MKNKVLYFIVLFVLLTVTVSAQEVNQQKKTHTIYCELVGTQKLSGKVRVDVDFGQEGGRYSHFFSNANTLVDENGKAIDFNSMVDAMNFMGEKGWVFVQAYVVSTGNTGGVYHWLLKREIVEGEENDIQVKGKNK